MKQNLRELLKRFWHDDAGGIISTEYFLLGSIVVMGSTAGMTALRDATVSEMKSLGNSIHAVGQLNNQSARIPGRTQQSVGSGTNYSGGPVGMVP